MTKPDGGPAFPVHPGVNRSIPGYAVSYAGMTLRDYFAGQALLGLRGDNLFRAKAEELAAISYSLADAMIAERDKA